MWVVGSLVFIVPAVLIAIQCLSRAHPATARPESLTKFQFEGARLYSSGRNSLSKGFVPRHDFSRAVNPFVITRGLQPPRDLLFRLFSKATANHKAFGPSSVSRTFELASFLILFAVTASVFVVLSRSSTDNDDQVLRASQQAGPFAVAVYGPAGDISVGPATFGVLVQDPNSHEVLLDSQVGFALSSRMAGDATVQQVRSVRETENKLLFSADLDFDSPGAQVLAIQVRQAGRSGTLSLPIEVMKSESGTSLRWSYIVTLTLVSILCAVYLLRHKTPRSERLAAPVT
jgi:hypothetical protein